ncbi:zinc ribbon domain-containing protein, partial [Enterobacter bugandensis]|uniref:zinc ribbon domain-containing protein n=2 Tax=Enterobacter TaxID=547 RepID=UPI002A817856
EEPLKEIFVIPDYYPALISEIDYLTLSKLDRHRAVTRSSSKYPEGNPEPEIPLLSGIGILFCGKCGSFMFKSGSNENKYRYICGSKIVQGKPCGKKGFTAYQLEHTVLQLIADHVWNNHQEDKTAWYESEIEKTSESIDKLLKLATLTDSLEELAEQIKLNKHNKATLEREFHQYKINRSEIQTTGWQQFRQFDVHDTKNPNRKQIRLKVKQAIRRIDCYDIDGRHGHFEVTFADETKQRIVIKFNRNRSPGVSYVEAQTVNDHDLLKMQGLVLHSFIDVLISPDKFAQHIQEKHEVSLLNPTYITELEDGIRHDEVNGIAIRVDGTTSKSYATINGIKHVINSLEDLNKISN